MVLKLNQTGMKRTILLLTAIFSIFACEKNNNQSGLFGTSKNIGYIGRFDDSHSSGPRFMYSGSSIRTNFSGTSIKMTLKDDSVRNYFNVFIDGNLNVLKTTGEESTYTLAENLEDKIHTLEIVRRTEWLGGNSTFMGFELDEGAELLNPDLKTHKIEFIGDSYICGYGIEGSGPDENFKYETENSYLAYSAITSRAVDADYVSICYSGIGLIQDYKGNKNFSMTHHYDDIINNGSKRWDYSSFRPDLVVIALGGNDVESNVDREQFIDTYIKFMKRVRNNYSNATIICVAGPSNPNELWPKIKEYVQSAADQYAKTADHVYYFEFTPMNMHGSNQHPTVAEHQVLAGEFIPFVKEVMGW
jgi:hypothetical protein